jgi:hypothetical protein
MAEDFELELRMLKKYKVVYNFQEPLLFYRLHQDQITYHGGKKGKQYWDVIRNNIISNVINN